MNQPEVTVVIPTRNRLGSLRQTLAGVLGQRDVEVEVVVVDEASTDGTTDYLGAHVDPRVRTVRHRRALGVATARNTGVTAARAPWVAFTDDDDLWAPTKLVRQLDAAEAQGAGWSCTGSVVVDTAFEIHRLHLPPTGDDLVAQLLRSNAIPGGASSVMARRDLIRSVGGFDPSLSNLADWDLWIRLALAAPLAAVDDPLVAYVVHRDAASHDVTRSLDEYRRLAEKHDDERRARGVALECWEWQRYLAECHLRAGRRLPAAAIRAREAVETRRLPPLAWAATALLLPDALGRRQLRMVQRSSDPRFQAATASLAEVPLDDSVEEAAWPSASAADEVAMVTIGRPRFGSDRTRSARMGAYVVVADHLDPPTLVIAGELDATTADLVAPVIFGALRARPGPWVFDLQYLAQIDDVGVALLAEVQVKAGPDHITMRDPPQPIGDASGRAVGTGRLGLIARGAS